MALKIAASMVFKEGFMEARHTLGTGDESESGGPEEYGRYYRRPQ